MSAVQIKMQVNRQHTTTAAAVSNTAVIWNKLSGSIHYKHTYTDNTNYNTGATLMLAARYKLTNNRPITALCAAVIFFNTVFLRNGAIKFTPYSRQLVSAARSLHWFGQRISDHVCSR